MPDWTKTMQQTFEYYVVDPGTWEDKKIIENVKSSTIDRDITTGTIASATIDVTDPIDECYIRIYLVTIQNGLKERHPLGTFLVQTPTTDFNGKYNTISVDAYSPLIELKEKYPPFGYALRKGTVVMDVASNLTSENTRAPVVASNSEITLKEDFVSDVNETWLSFLTDFINKAEYEFELDEMSRIIFSKKQDTASLRPVFTYDDGNSSILYPEVKLNHDLYNVPNVVEVIYSNNDLYFYAKVVNSDKNSPTSTVNRGRQVIHRVTNPSFSGEPSQSVIDKYAEQTLRDLSSVEYTLTYTHGYYPVRLNDCVRFNYSKADLTDIKARVISQTIKCVPGCPVTEKAVFNVNLWR